eukprot:TRINITY_DN54027_c0_g1_i1.p1 TRINITY_DN54027_c0_g1~~TRINITY_DN54027_c0_g1_i1.p1  ORF type:complete len:540 (-),score=52.19 TRINITY_DN54027_c0_g1_i1:140-1759(-)
MLWRIACLHLVPTIVLALRQTAHVDSTNCKTVSSELGLTDAFVDIEKVFKAQRRGRWVASDDAKQMMLILALLKEKVCDDDIQDDVTNVCSMAWAADGNIKSKYQESITRILDSCRYSRYCDYAACEVYGGERISPCQEDLVVAEGDILTWEKGGPDFHELAQGFQEAADELYPLPETRAPPNFATDAQPETQTPPDSDRDSQHETWAPPDSDTDSLPETQAHLDSDADSLSETSASPDSDTASISSVKAHAPHDPTPSVWSVLAGGFKRAGRAAGKYAEYKGYRAGASVMESYARSKQTIGALTWTHTELAMGPRLNMGFFPPQLFTNGSFSEGGTHFYDPATQNFHGSKVLVHRFRHSRNVASLDCTYAQLAARRAKLWSTELTHYMETYSEMSRVVFTGRCINRWGRRLKNAGDHPYFKAVTPEVVADLWHFEKPADNAGQSATGAAGKRKGRKKPKAMFCSKYVAAAWSSAIGNPTDKPDEPVRHQDVNVMFPFNPGACAPWTMAKWLVNEGRKHWSTCIGDPRKLWPLRYSSDT